MHKALNMGRSRFVMTKEDVGKQDRAEIKAHLQDIVLRLQECDVQGLKVNIIDAPLNQEELNAMGLEDSGTDSDGDALGQGWEAGEEDSDVE